MGSIHIAPKTFIEAVTGYSLSFDQPVGQIAYAPEFEGNLHNTPQWIIKGLKLGVDDASGRIYSANPRALYAIRALPPLQQMMNQARLINNPNLKGSAKAIAFKELGINVRAISYSHIERIIYKLYQAQQQLEDEQQEYEQIMEITNQE